MRNRKIVTVALMLMLTGIAAGSYAGEEPVRPSMKERTIAILAENPFSPYWNSGIEKVREAIRKTPAPKDYPEPDAAYVKLMSAISDAKDRALEEPVLDTVLEENTYNPKEAETIAELDEAAEIEDYAEPDNDELDKAEDARKALTEAIKNGSRKERPSSSVDYGQPPETGFTESNTGDGMGRHSNKQGSLSSAENSVYHDSSAGRYRHPAHYGVPDVDTSSLGHNFYGNDNSVDTRIIYPDVSAPNNIIIEEDPSIDGYDTSAEDVSRLLTYRFGTVDQITTCPGYLTDILLQPGEQILRITAGDKSRWTIDTQYSGADGGIWHIYVKPSQYGLETNLIVVTDRHSYQLLMSTGTEYDPIVRWQYPGESYVPVMASRDEAVEVESVDKLNFGYAVNKRRGTDWAPQFVFDDGFRTFIQIPEGELKSCNPAIFAERGNMLQFVSYRVSGNNLVVEGVYEGLQLRVKNELVRVRRETA